MGREKRKIVLKDGTVKEIEYEVVKITVTMQKDTLAFYNILKQEGVNISGLVNELIKQAAVDLYPEYIEEG